MKDQYDIPPDVKPWEYFKQLKQQNQQAPVDSFEQIPPDVAPWEYFKQLKQQNSMEQYAGQPESTPESVVQTPPTPNVAAPQAQEGLGRTVLEKGLKGATFGFGDEASDAIGAGIASLLTDETFSQLYDEARAASKQRDINQSSQNPLVSFAAEAAGSLLTGAGLGATKAGANLAKTINTGSRLSRTGKAIGTSAAAGATYGAGSAYEDDRLEGAGEGALIGAAAGTIIPAAKAIKDGVKNVVYPAVEDTTRQLAQRARDLGIPLSVVQISPTRAKQQIQTITQPMPFSGQKAFDDKQQSALGRAALRTVGLKGDKLDPEAIKTFLTKSKRDYDSVFSGVTVRPTADKVKLLDDYLNEMLGSHEQGTIDVLARNIDRIKKDLSSDVISGKKFNSIISNLKRNIANADRGGVKKTLSGLPDVLNKIAFDDIPVDKKVKLLEANKNWKRYKILQDASKESVDGSIIPSKLYPAIKRNKYINQQEIPIGQDELVDLGRISRSMLGKLGGSETAMKQIYLGTGGTIGGIGGIAAGAAGGAAGLTNYLAGLGIAAGASRAIQNINRLQPYVNKILEKQGQSALSDVGLAQAILSGTIPTQVLNSAIYNTTPKESKELQRALQEIRGLNEESNN